MNELPSTTVDLEALIRQQLSRHPSIELLNTTADTELHTRHHNGQNQVLHSVVSFEGSQRRIEVADIDQAAARVKEEQLSCLVLLTGVGISRDAWIQGQVQRQVKWVTLGQALQLDWLDDLAERIVNRQVIIPELSDFVFSGQSEGQERRFHVPEREALDSDFTDSDIIVRDAAGNSQTLHRVYDEEVEAARFKGAGKRQLTVDFAEGTNLILPTGRRHGITRLQFDYQQRVIEENLDLCGNDLVALVLFSLFEDRHFVLSARGDIYATQPSH
ncbi:hypothetical protein [Salinicola avicenniae]|uniref:hypothetical protein n=1 Tax=Salinicola avicenniae TaxID=2916836 RepID=UPI002073FC0B|nr:MULTISPECIES: hypothetical protein [unclassified Salinicola]